MNRLKLVVRVALLFAVITGLAATKLPAIGGGNCWYQLQSCEAGCSTDRCLLICQCNYAYCENLPESMSCWNLIEP